MRSISRSLRIWLKGLGLSFAGLFFVLLHGLAQSLITTYVGPQLPVSGDPALNQAIDFPSDVIPDGAGGLYVVSTNQNRVYRIAANGTLMIVAGSTYGFSGDSGQATDARLAAPSGLARDAMGNLYIADTRNNRIRKVTTDGVITTIVGTDTAGFSGDGGPATSAQLSLPSAITLDREGNIYFADTINNRVRKVSVDGVISTVAGGGSSWAGLSGIPATSAAISPTGVAVDAAGNLYIASGFVLRVGQDGITNVLAQRTGTQGGRGGFICSPSGDGGPASTAVVCYPNRLAVDSAGNLYLTDGGMVRKITTDGIIHTVAGGVPCSLDGSDGQPATSVCLRAFSVAVGGDGSLYISEADDSGLARSDPSRVRKVTPDGLITTILANTISGFEGDGGPATSAQLSSPGPIAVDAAGNLYIADYRNNRVRKVTPDGMIRTIAGNGIFGFAGDGGPAPSAEIRPPLDLFVDGSNNVYILQDDEHVRKITTDGLISTIAGCFGSCVGAPDQDGVVATQAVLRVPRRIAVDATGTLYIVEEDRVRKVGADGIITTVATFDNDNHYSILGFALDPAGGFYITSRQTDNCRILKLSPDGSTTTVAGSGPCGFGGNGDGGPATSAELSVVSDIKLDAAGNIYLAEYPRVRKISTDGTISTVAGGVNMRGFSGDGGAATSAQLNDFFDIAVDAAGNLYISDNGNHRIRKVSPSTATRSFNLAASAADYRATISVPGPVAVGYGTVQPGVGNTTPAGTSVFSYHTNGVLVSETAVPASSLRRSGRIYAESGGPVRTGIAIANPSNDEAVISFYFTDRNGVILNGGTTTLPAHEQYAAFLDQVPYHGTEMARSFTFTSSVPVGAIALRLYFNERGESLMTTLPVASVSPNAIDTAPSAGNITLPHFAAGAGWTTQVLLVNPTDQPLSGTVDMDATYTYGIAPRSSTKIVSTNSDLLRTGNIRITPAQGSGSPIVSSVFTLVANGITVTETGIATTGVAPSFRVFAESDSGHQLQTGIAIANTAATLAKIQFELLTLDGRPSGYAGSSTLDPNGHMAVFLNEIPGLHSLPSSFRGVLHISSNTSISAIGLRTRYNGRGDFLISTTPAIADNTPSSTEEFVFPQVVSGSGYTTEFILINSAVASQGTLSLKSQTGTELPLFVP